LNRSLSKTLVSTSLVPAPYAHQKLEYRILVEQQRAGVARRKIAARKAVHPPWAHEKARGESAR